MAGPLGNLATGRYRMTIEATPGERALDRSDHDQALVVDVTTEGILLGSQPVSFIEFEAGTLAVDFSVPARLSSKSLQHGAEVAIRSRGRVSGTIEAVLLRQIEIREPIDVTETEWLAAMDAGEAGVRAGVEVNTVSDDIGLVVSGPHWRLPPGDYEIRARFRLVGDDRYAIGGPPDDKPIFDIQVAQPEGPLRRFDVTMKSVRTGDPVASQFSVGTGGGVDVRILVLRAVEAAVVSVQIALTSGPG